jgi:hypothetical protein
VERTAGEDERIRSLDERIAAAEGAERQALRAQRSRLWADVLAQQRRACAERFDSVHSVERAVQMGSVSSIISPSSLRGFLIEAVERGMRRSGEAAASGAVATSTNGRPGLAHPTPS